MMTYCSQNQQAVSSDRLERESGISLVELMLSLVLVVITLILLQSSLLSATKNRVATKGQDLRNTLSYDYMQRLTTIPFGTAADPAATGAQLSELFDDDQDLGSVTLKGLQTAPGTAGHSFSTTVEGVTTAWRVSVTADLDGDGLVSGFREGRTDLLQIEVFGDNRLMFRTVRAADFPNTTKD